MYALTHRVTTSALGLAGPAGSVGPGPIQQGIAVCTAPLKGGLASWQQKLTCAYIEEHLAANITLADLAGLARLSPFHFCRVFKESVGISPHRYHMQQRVERAKALLAERVLSVGGVALATGFGGPSQFTTAFRKLTGQTPTSYRASFRPVARLSEAGAANAAKHDVDVGASGCRPLDTASRC